jgi:hypothetical protein
MIALLSFFLILFASPFQVEEPTEFASGHKQTLTPFLGHVRFAPESRHGSASLPCPLCATGGQFTELLRRPAAINRDCSTGDIVRRGVGEPQGERSDFLWPRRSPAWLFFGE